MLANGASWHCGKLGIARFGMVMQPLHLTVSLWRDRVSMRVARLVPPNSFQPNPLAWLIVAYGLLEGFFLSYFMQTLQCFWCRHKVARNNFKANICLILMCAYCHRERFSFLAFFHDLNHCCWARQTMSTGFTSVVAVWVHGFSVWLGTSLWSSMGRKTARAIVTLSSLQPLQTAAEVSASPCWGPNHC